MQPPMTTARALRPVDVSALVDFLGRLQQRRRAGAAAGRKCHTIRRWL